MITFTGILAFFEKFANQHMQINSFSEGDLSKIELKKINEYPLLHVDITSTSIEDNTIVYNVDAYILTGINNDEADEWREDSLANTLLIMQDLRTEFFKGKYVVGQDLLLQGSETITCNPIDEQFNNRVFGWSTSMSVTGVNESTACNIPYSPTIIYQNYKDGTEQSEIVSPIKNMKEFLWWSANINLQENTEIVAYVDFFRIHTLQAVYRPNLYTASTSKLELIQTSTDFCEYDMMKGGIRMGGRIPNTTCNFLGLCNLNNWKSLTNTAYTTDIFAFKVSHIANYDDRLRKIALFNLGVDDRSEGFEVGIFSSTALSSASRNKVYFKPYVGSTELISEGNGGFVSDESTEFFREEDLIICLQVSGAQATPVTEQHTVKISVNGFPELSVNVASTIFTAYQKFQVGIGGFADSPATVPSTDFILKDFIAFNTENANNAPSLQDIYRWLKNK